MNRFCGRLLILGVLFLAATTRADDLVKFPTGDAAWTVDVTYSASSGIAPTPTPTRGPSPPPTSPLSEKPKKIEVTQVGGLQRIHVTWISGGSHERWAVSKYFIVLEDDPRTDVIFPALAGSMEEKWAEFNLPYGPRAFSWIEPKNLVEPDPVTFQGKKCFHYQGNVLPPFPHSKEQKRSAWIDSDTLLPVALATENSLNLFTFAKPNTDRLVLPPKFQEAFDEFKQASGVR
jgi:hypothetical protein